MSEMFLAYIEYNSICNNITLDRFREAWAQYQSLKETGEVIYFGLLGLEEETHN